MKKPQIGYSVKDKINIGKQNNIYPKGGEDVYVYMQYTINSGIYDFMNKLFSSAVHGPLSPSLPSVYAKAEKELLYQISLSSYKQIVSSPKSKEYNTIENTDIGELLVATGEGIMIYGHKHALDLCSEWCSHAFELMRGYQPEIANSESEFGYLFSVVNESILNFQGVSALKVIQ
jgi:hypothetical protein